MRILVKQKFTYNDPHTNEKTVFEPGVHTVTDEVANHHYTQHFIDASFVDVPVVVTAEPVPETVVVSEVIDTKVKKPTKV